jgi:hypothetical protein
VAHQAAIDQEFEPTKKKNKNRQHKQSDILFFKKGKKRKR